MSLGSLEDLILSSPVTGTADVQAAKIKALHALLVAPAEMRALLGAMPLSKFPSMWATYSVTQPDEPFAGYDSTANCIRANLGLSRAEAGTPIVLIQYQANGIPLQIPTVADAYAGASWNYYFCPCPATGLLPLTVPWDDWTTPTPIPRPEVIHQVVTTNAVTKPLEPRY